MMLIMVGQIPTGKNSLCMLSLTIHLQFCIPGGFTVFSYSAQNFLKTAGFSLREKLPCAQEDINFHFLSKEPADFEVC